MGKFVLKPSATQKEAKLDEFLETGIWKTTFFSKNLATLAVFEAWHEADLAWRCATTRPELRIRLIEGRTESKIAYSKWKPNSNGFESQL